MALPDVLGAVNAASDIGHTVWDIFTQEKTWNREDTAIQRRVADLKAAGLSPTLAAGSAAQTSSPISVNQPNLSADIQGPQAAATALLRQKQDIATSAAQEELLRENGEAQKYANAINAAERSLKTDNGPGSIVQQAAWNLQTKQAIRDKAVADAQAAANNAQLLGTSAAEAAYNLGMAQAEGIRTRTAPGLVGQALTAGEMVHKLLSNIRANDGPRLELNQKLKKVR